MALESQPDFVHYIPIATTVIAVLFVGVLFRRHREKGGGLHLVWWGAGVACYGLGTGLEGAITLLGNSVALNKAWYVAGALLGAYPLAQGTVYLLLDRRTAKRLTGITLPMVALLAVLVVLSPVEFEAFEAHRPSGAILGWRWVRWLTPIVNVYAAGFLVGGAVVSSWRYAKTRVGSGRAVGNALIAAGALLPAIGGGLAKAGTIEALYIAEFIGLLLIWAGYGYCVQTVTAPTNSR